MKEKITHLKKILRHSEDFKATMDYFFNVLVIDPSFSKSGVVVEKSPMNSIIKGTGKKFFKKDRVNIHVHQSMEIKAYKLFHGFVAMEDMKGVYFYFEGIGGMINLSGGRDGLVHYARMTQLPSHMVMPTGGQRFEA